MYDKETVSTAAEHGFADTTETPSCFQKQLSSTKKQSFFFTRHFSMRRIENFRQSPIKIKKTPPFSKKKKINKYY